MTLTWTAWNNGRRQATGAGYGMKVPVADRDRYFRRDVGVVMLELPMKETFSEVAVNTNKPSFWNDTCHELISKKIGEKIGEWLIASGHAGWPRGAPPRITAEVLGGDRFRVVGIARGTNSAP